MILKVSTKSLLILHPSNSNPPMLALTLSIFPFRIYIPHSAIYPYPQAIAPSAKHFGIFSGTMLYTRPVLCIVNFSI